MSKRAHSVLGALLVLAGVPGIAPGQSFTSTSGMPVRVEIIASCAVTAADLDFGAYNAAAVAPLRGQTNIQLDCSAGSLAEVSLDAGTGSGGSTKRRQLEAPSGNDRLDYGLYQDAGRTVHWGDRSGVDTREVLTTGAPQALPVYGEIPAGQQVGPGTYSDEITVRVLY